MNKTAAPKNRNKNIQRQGKVPLKAPSRNSDQKVAFFDEPLRFERLITDLSARFVNITPEEVDREIEHALEQIRDFYQVERVGMVGFSPDRKRVHITHMACAEGIERVSGEVELSNLFPWIYARVVLQGAPVFINKLKDLPKRAEKDSLTCTAMGILSFVNIPLFLAGEIVSLIFINAMREERSWPKGYGPRLRLLGEIFINALARRNGDRALRESEARLASAIDIAALGFYEIEEDDHVSFLDNRMRELLGIAREEQPHAYDFWLANIHADDRLRVLELSRQALEEGIDRFATEYRYMHPQRGLIWLHHLSHIMERNAAGRAIHVIGVMQDITRPKLLEAVRMEGMERYHAVVEAFDGLIYICSPEYRVEFMNQRLIERTGRNAVGELCYKALHDRDSICEWCVNERVFQGETVRWEVQSPKDHCWYYVTNTPIRHADGTISKHSMIMDITERKNADEELKQSEAALKSSQNDFRKLAGKLISAREEELRRVSRELHDDLTQRLAVLAIAAGKLELDLNKMTEAHPDTVQMISEIKEGLIKVSEDVHRISRQLHPTILDDLGLVRAIESECSAFMRRVNIEVIFRRENVPDVIDSDIALCLYRIVQEGLRNISAHSSANNCEIFLEGSDNILCLAVTDDGVGFESVDVRQMPGLGLSSMRERAQLVQGDFSITSRPGQGVVIRICVPLKGGEA